MSYVIKKISQDILKSKKFEYLALWFSNLDTAIIERKAIKKFEIDTILTGGRFNAKSVLKFRLELNKAYCDNKLLEYDYDPHGRIPLEERETITELIDNKKHISIQDIYLLDKELEQYDEYNVFYKYTDIGTPNTDVYIRKRITEDTISLMMDMSFETAIIYSEFELASDKYLSKREAEQSNKMDFMREKKAVEEFMKNNNEMADFDFGATPNSVYFYRICFLGEELNVLNRNGYMTIEETIEALRKEPPIKYPNQYGDIQIIIEKHYFSDEYAYCKVTFNREWEVTKIETIKKLECKNNDRCI